jgi:hypothetical protein
MQKNLQKSTSQLSKNKHVDKEETVAAQKKRYSHASHNTNLLKHVLQLQQLIVRKIVTETLNTSSSTTTIKA